MGGTQACSIRWGEPLLAALVGLFGGVLMGLAARLGQFCSLGAIEDTLYAQDTRRLRMWGVAIGVAVVGTYACAMAGIVDPTQSAYLVSAWNPLASILGGLVFGYGMALAGNCGFGALARAGGGDLRSFVIVLVMGLAAYATLSGPLASTRVALFPIAPSGDSAVGIAHTIALGLGVGSTVVGLLLGALILILSLANASFRQSPMMVVWAIVVGVAIVSGWVGTFWIAENGFSAIRPQSHTFAAPLGETMLYTMTASGRSISFSVGSVAGVLAGACLGSLIKGHFRWEACEDPRELRRQILGAVLVGMGAVVAIGCTVGQGLSAFSVLAISAPVTSAAIFVGCAIGLRQLITGFHPAE